MSAIEVKKNTEINLIPDREIDLLELLSVLYAAKKQILTGIIVFALVGLAIAYLLPQKWTSQAIITPSEITQWQEMEQQLARLQVLDIDTKVTRSSVFDLFIKKLQSRSMLEEFLTSSPWVRAQLNDADMQSDEIHRIVVNMAEKMKFASNQAKAGAESTPYSAWTLSFVATTAQDAQDILKGYIDYVSAAVEEEAMQNIRNAVSVKRLLEEGRLAQRRMHLENLRSVNVERLNYALEIANAAGIKKPIYSSSMVAGDDPDYQIMLGADGIEQKLAIEKSITDVAKQDVDFNNRQYQLDQLRQIVVADIHFEPFKYQLSPSLPVTKDNPGKSIIVLLAAVLGGLLTSVGILLRRAMTPFRL